MKDKIIELLLSTERKGIENLIQHMGENGFFTAPCSSQYHLCKEGGLAEHSLNVYKTMDNVAVSLEIYDTAKFTEELILTSLLHDLGKMGQYGKALYTENYLASGKISEKKPFETNKQLLAIPHEIRSIQIAERFIELTEAESHAILYHNGLYGDLKYAYSGKETELSMLLHFSDLWCSRVTEKED